MSEQRTDTGNFAASTGLTMTDATWLDAHFETNRPEFEEIVRSVDIQPGWHVLDVGCGAGSFLPLLAARVGPSGHLTALDLAPDNIAAVHAHLAEWRLPCPVDPQVGSILALPFSDNSFDAVWCANILMYLTDDALPSALAELRRVIRPGGMLIAKETDGTLCVFYPIDSSFMWPLVIARGNVPGAQRSRGLRFWFQQAGLTVASHRMIIIERHAPLRPVERQFLGDALTADAAGVLRLDATVGVPPATRDFWRAQRDPDDPGCIVNRLDFTWCEGICVFVACKS